MKLLTILLFLSFFLGSVILNAQNVTIPDANFKAYLVGNAAINTNGDGEIQVSEAVAFSDTINCSNLNIHNMTGIEAFVNLRALNCRQNSINSLDVTQLVNLTYLECLSNDLTSLDVSQNIGLSYLHCGSNDLTSLNVSSNINLLYLLCESNFLTSLNISQNVNLITFWCYFNQITSLNLTQNINLENLLIGNNQLTSLDISSNVNLVELSCSSNQLTSLDVSFNPNLIRLICSSNQLTTLNLAQTTSLETLYCRSNQLVNLDVSLHGSLDELVCNLNQLTTLNVKNGNNTNFTIFRAENNPDLLCIEVDSVGYSQSNWTSVDAGVAFNTDCGIYTQIINIPDANFKAYLTNNPNVNLNGDGEIQVYEALYFASTLNCSNLNIADLTGIEEFINLRELNCASNQLVNLDLTNNTNLRKLNCTYNQLTSLDLTNNTSLDELFCQFNNLTSLLLGQSNNLFDVYCNDNQLINLDLSPLVNLYELYCENNQLNNINVSQNLDIYTIYCQNNQLTSLDFSSNTYLEELNCSSNSLINLNMKNTGNTNIYIFNTTSNPNLTCIEVDDSTYSANNWTNIDPTASFSTNCSIFSNITSIGETVNATAYPNPTAKDITLDLGRTYQEATIQVTNLTGQAVLNKTLVNTSTTTLELNGAVGVYFVTISTQEGTAVLKVVKE